MSARLLLALPLLLSVCFAQVQPAQSAHRTPSSAQIYGFQGPIHTSKYVIRQLEKDPRPQAKLPLRLAQKGWMVFDESGQLIEEGDLDAAGKIEHVMRRYYDGDGQENTTELIDGQKITRYALETRTAADGGIERRNLVNGVLQSTIVSRSTNRRLAAKPRSPMRMEDL